MEEEYGFTGEPDSASATKKLDPVVNVTIMASSPPPTGTINVPCPTCGTVLEKRVHRRPEGRPGVPVAAVFSRCLSIERKSMG